MDSNQFRQAAHSAVEQIIDYYDTIRDKRVLSDVKPGYLRELIPPGIPEQGENWKDIQKDIEEKIVPGLTHWQSPNFLAFYPANSTYPGILGELYSATYTCAAFNWQCSPAITELETIVLDNVAKLLNLPDVYLSAGEGGGVIQGSASEAIVTVMVAARDRYISQSKEAWKASGLSEDEIEENVCQLRGRFVALGSDQAHSSTKKAAMIAGVRFETINTVIGEFTLDGEALQKKLEELEKRKLVPFYLTATLGSTATCAVDDFESISETLRKYHSSSSRPHIWTHIDAAYAGAALIMPQFQHIPAVFASFADSFNFNMHKWLLTNFDCSCLYITKRRYLIDALSITPAYLRNEFSDAGLVTDYRDWQIPLGRRFRSLKMWFVTRSYGVEGMRAHIAKSLAAGEAFTKLVMAHPEKYTLVAKPAFALNVLRVNPPPEIASKLKGQVKEYGKYSNEITTKVADRINKEGKIFLTPTVLGSGDESITAIRVVSGAPKVEVKDLENAFEIISEVVDKIWAEEVESGNYLRRLKDQVELQAI